MDEPRQVQSTSRTARPSDEGPATVEPTAPKPFLTPNRLILWGLALAAALVTIWDLSDGYPSMELGLLELVLWPLVFLLWLGTIIGSIVRHETLTARDLVAWSLVPLSVGVVMVLASGPAVDLRFRWSVAELDALADRIVAGETTSYRPTAGSFDVLYHEAYGNEVLLTIGHAGFLDDIMLVRDGDPGGCTERRQLDDRWALCYIAY
jgi:hypothetical protein